MPYLWENNKVAVELSELVPRFWNTAKNLQQELWRYKDRPYGIKRLQIGGNGRKMLVDFDTLKEDIQEVLGDPRKIGNPLELFFQFDSEAPEYYARFKRNGVSLSFEEQERYIINASVMSAIIKLEQRRISERLQMKGSLQGIWQTLINDMIDFQNWLKVNYDTEHTLPTSRRFKEVLKACKDELYYPLIKDPNGTGKQNARIVDDQLEMLLNAMFKGQSHKPTPTEVARYYESFLNGYAELYNQDTGELYDPKDFKKVSLGTIVKYLNKWQNKIATYKARSGDRQVYMGLFKPAHDLDMPKYAGSIISIDDRQPPFEYEKGKRMWFYIGVDIASQAFTTVVWGKSKEGLIVDFYRQMVRNYVGWGLPLPYELECESSLNSSYKDTLLRQGAMFSHVRIEANNARGKYIERMFGKLRYEDEKQSVGWIARPKSKKESNQSGQSSKVIIPYDQLVNERLIDLEDWNNTAHPDKNDVSRFDYFLNTQHKDLKPINWHGILPYIGYKTETSCRVAKVTLQGRKRAIAENGKILTGSALIEKMTMIEGKDIEVYWLDDNDGNVLKAYAYFNDKFVCEIMEMPRYNRATLERTGADKEARELQSAYVATIEAFTKSQLTSIESVGIIDKTPKLVNNNFKFSNIRRFEVKEPKPVEVFEDEQEDEIYYKPNASSTPRWREAFQ